MVMQLVIETTDMLKMLNPVTKLHSNIKFDIFPEGRECMRLRSTLEDRSAAMFVDFPMNIDNGEETHMFISSTELVRMLKTPTMKKGRSVIYAHKSMSDEDELSHVDIESFDGNIRRTFSPVKNGDKTTIKLDTLMQNAAYKTYVSLDPKTLKEMFDVIGSTGQIHIEIDRNELLFYPKDNSDIAQYKIAGRSDVPLEYVYRETELIMSLNIRGEPLKKIISALPNTMHKIRIYMKKDFPLIFIAQDVLKEGDKWAILIIQPKR